MKTHFIRLKKKQQQNKKICKYIPSQPTNLFLGTSLFKIFCFEIIKRLKGALNAKRVQKKSN